MFRTLRTRLLASYLLIILVTLTLTGATLAILTRRLESVVALRGLEDQAYFVSLVMGNAMRRGRTADEVVQELQGIPGGRARRVLLLTWQGVILADSEGVLQGETIPLARRDARPPLGLLPRPFSGEYVTPQGERLYYAAVPVFARGGGMMGARLLVAVVAPLREMRTLARELFLALAQAGAVGLLLAIGLGLFIARSISLPLAHAASAAEGIARGRFDQQVPRQGPQEVLRLADSFNRMAREVQASRQAQRDFVANVSHDLKTPLTSIQGYAQALMDGTAQDEETRRRAAAVIHEEAQRMGRLVEQLLDLARIDAGQITFASEPVDLSALLRATAERFALCAQEAGVTLKVEVEPLPMVRGDGDRLMQVFSNLLDNALSHTPAGGIVTLAAQAVQNPAKPKAAPHASRGDGRDSPPAAAVEVSVADTGPGIPPEDLPRIFERFYQVDKSRGGEGRRRGSVGLGLAIVQEIVQAHGGEVKVESVQGLGARFIVRLPVA
jgi:two-component system OmpR family sensor kinase